MEAAAAAAEEVEAAAEEVEAAGAAVEGVVAEAAGSSGGGIPSGEPSASGRWRAR